MCYGDIWLSSWAGRSCCLLGRHSRESCKGRTGPGHFEEKHLMELRDWGLKGGLRVVSRQVRRESGMETPKG